MSDSPELPAGLSAALRERFNALSAEEQARVLARFRERRRSRVVIPRRERLSAPLTDGQQRVWFLQQLSPESSSFNQSHIWLVRGQLDIEALVRSLTEIVRRHESLRTQFIIHDGEPRQEPAPCDQFHVEVLDVRGLEDEHRPRSIEDFERRITLSPFDLSSPPLVRAGIVITGPNEHRLVIVRHHIASDRWSAGLFLDELATGYAAFRNGEVASLPELPVQYGDYASWARERSRRPEAEAALSAVLKGLEGIGRPSSLLPELERHAESERGKRAWGRVSQDSIARLRALCRANGSTLFMGLLAVFGTLVHRYTGATDLVVGTPIAGRLHPDLEPLIGLFSNINAQRLDLSGDPTFVGLLARVRSEVMRALDHQEVPFERVMEVLRPPGAARVMLTPLLFALQNVPYSGLRLSGVDVEEIDSPIEAFAADVGLITWESDGELILRADYNADLFSDGLIRRMLAHFAVLTRAVTDSPQALLSRLPLLTEDERYELIVARNATSLDYPKNRRIDELFDEHVTRHPDAIAVIAHDGQLSYGELHRHAERISQRLRGAGVGRGDRVALLLKGSSMFVAAVLGTYKAGAAYVAIDPEGAPGRRQLVLDDADPKATIVEVGSIAMAPPHRPVLQLDDNAAVDWPAAAPENPTGVSSEDIACVLYTSGSTGQPKGVLTTHRAVVNHSLWIARSYGMGAAERVLQASPFSFDASMWELTMPLITGGIVVIGSPLGRIDPPAFLDSIIQNGITTLLLVPAQIPFLLDRPELDKCVSLKNVFVGGEVFPARLAARLSKRIPARIHNIYGPTETCVNSTMHEWRPGDADDGTVPIGAPIGNTEVFVLDDRGELLPSGVPGELYIGGEGLSLGYLNAPDLTSRRLVSHPFKPGARLYRTGDRVRWNEAGQLEFAGRLDDQFKLRGIRIEPGEIEATLLAHPAIAAAAAVIRGAGEDARLVAFLVRHHDSNVPPDVELRAFVRDRLPEVMVPAAYRWLDELPLNTHGKVDRGALPDVIEEPIAAPAPPVASETEARLRALWLEVLKRHDVGPEQHFFDVGGNSLLAVRLFARIEEEFGIRLRISKLFDAPTIRALAGAIDSSRPTTWTPLVVIRAEGSRPPLYVVHGIGGEVLAFEPFARALPPEQPVFGFESDVWDGREMGTVSDTAAMYRRVLQDHQPAGPYFLAGYSSGGMLAFEMACQLEAAGHKVGLLILVDAGVPPRALHLQERPPLPPSDYVDHVLHWVVDDLLASPADLWLGRVKSKARLMAATLKAHLSSGRDAAARAEVADVRDRLGMWRYPTEYRKALERRWEEFVRYEPGRFSGPALVLRSRTGRLLRPRRVTTGWEPLVSGRIEQHMVRGSHDNILQEPRVCELARLVANAIERSHASMRVSRA
jgi:amino acid adenylation domain-containing protein